MNFLKNLFVFLLMLGICAPTYAAVGDIGPDSCGVYNDGDKKDGDKKEGEEEEEPDCE